MDIVSEEKLVHNLGALLSPLTWMVGPNPPFMWEEE